MERMGVVVPVWWMMGEWMEGWRKEKDGVDLVVECLNGGGWAGRSWMGWWMDGQLRWEAGWMNNLSWHLSFPHITQV